MWISSGRFARRRLKTPPGSTTRPTSAKVKGAFLNICQHQLPDSRVLDLFAGSGAIGFEALSRGAASVCFVEANRSACHCIHDNLATLGVEGMARVLRGDVSTALKRLAREGQAFDLIYADPPYGALTPDGTLCAQEILQVLDGSPLVHEHTRIFIEEGVRSPSFGGGLKTLVRVDARVFGTTRLEEYRAEQEHS